MICERLEKLDRRAAIKKLAEEGYTKEEATKYYNAWRYNYVRTYGGRRNSNYANETS